eukprot:6090729-Ditylum_brightwellii.AAC.1
MTHLVEAIMREVGFKMETHVVTIEIGRASEADLKEKEYKHVRAQVEEDYTYNQKWGVDYTANF